MPRIRTSIAKDLAHIPTAASGYRRPSEVPFSEIASSVNPNTPLTSAAKSFVRFWAQGESISSAAAKADLSTVHAYRLARYPQAVALYNSEKAKYEDSCQMTRKRVMEGLLDGVEMAKLAGEPMAVIAGWREVGRMCGYYEPIKQRIEINITGNLALDRLNKLSDKELLDILTETIHETPEAPLLLVDEITDSPNPALELADE